MSVWGPEKAHPIACKQSQQLTSVLSRLWPKQDAQIPISESQGLASAHLSSYDQRDSKNATQLRGESSETTQLEHNNSLTPNMDFFSFFLCMVDCARFHYTQEVLALGVAGDV